MRRARLATALLLLVVAPSIARGQQVFTGDPVDAGTGQAFPIMPGLPLVLPGGDGEFGTGDDVNDPGLVGDVDLVVRSGIVAGPAIPAPSLAPGGAPIATVVAGGGSSGVGSERDFTVMVSDGTGSPPFGNVVPNADMDLRPVTVYAFADLDGDGILGPNGLDGSSDNALELQEVTAYAGRQMGGLGSGRFQDSLGIEMGAPASIGGLSVGLVAGAYTGSDPEQLFTDGPLVLTHWPFFPPLDPHDLLGGGANPAPEPDLANELEWDIERNYRPAASHPTLGASFAVRVDGSEPTTDQLTVVSAAAVSARVFAETAAGDFVARGRPRLRVAPAQGSSGRTLVLPVDRVVLAADGALSQLALRVLPVDLFANVADPGTPLTVTLTLGGPASIVSPDLDGNPATETLVLDDAAGAEILLDDAGGSSATLELAIDSKAVATLAVEIGPADVDGDGIADDGNGSGASGDAPCDVSAASCDDNCPRVINPSQVDSNHDGLGDCCDGTCIHDPLAASCDECALPAGPTSASFSNADVRVRPGEDADRVKLKLDFVLDSGASIAPDAETVSVFVTQTGSGGYSAELASVFTDRTRSLADFRYADRLGSLDGVLKAQIKRRRDGTWRMTLRASGPALADLAGGGAELLLAIGEDVVGGTLACTGDSRLHCELVP